MIYGVGSRLFMKSSLYADGEACVRKFREESE